jgi:uncharacterized protein (UPF0333 family)
MKKCPKGQISLEYGLVIGFSLLILIPTILIAQSYSSTYQDKISVHEAQRAIDIIVSTADTVFLEGAPARRTIKVNLPEHIENITTQNRSILIHMNDNSQVSYATSQYATIIWDANYRGKGSYSLMIQAESSAVRIRDAE